MAALNLQKSLADALTLSPQFQAQLDHLNLTGNVVGLPFALIIAYLMAPLSVRLLRPPDSIPAPQEANRARVATILTALAAALLGILVSYCEATVFQQLQPHSNIVTQGIMLAFAAIRQIPAILLALALYLIAYPDSPLAAAPQLTGPLPESPLPSSAE